MISWNAYLIDRVGDSLSATRVAPWKNGDFHFPGRINKQAKYWKFPDEKSLAARFLSSTRELWWNIPINGSPSRAKGGQGNWCTKVCSKTATCGNYTHTRTRTNFNGVFSGQRLGTLCYRFNSLNRVKLRGKVGFAKGKGHSLPRLWLFGAIFWHYYRAILCHLFFGESFSDISGIFHCCFIYFENYFIRRC